MELLSPAGSKASFIASVSAKADAVYCGLKDFSARSKAQNFSPQELNDYIAFAHSKNVKVYVALNTLIKQSELNKAIETLAQISQAKADAIIVQDFGVLNISKKYFPNLKLHASTQMTIHNSYGVQKAKEFGFKRAVLARELSFNEIKEIAKSCDLELEVFCHGALCFSVSGLCLMSSYIGGNSGNRGKCAQPCRRIWNFENKSGFYLSPKDLCLIDYVKDLQDIGVKSLKIEGRMKNPQYVYKTITAYKMVKDIKRTDADYERVLNEAKTLLSNDFARQKTTFNFINCSNDIFSPKVSKQVGTYLGKISDIRDNFITIKTNIKINQGDILKSADTKNDLYTKFKVISIFKNNDLCKIETDINSLKSGLDVYKISDGIFEKKLNEIIKNTKIEKTDFKFTIPKMIYPKFQNKNTEQCLYLKIDNFKWADFIPKNNTYKIVYLLNKENMNSNFSQFDYFELPSYIAQKDLKRYQEIINSFKGKTIFINNISHLNFFKNLDNKIVASKGLYTLNSFCVDFLIKNNICLFMFSIEDEFKNITNLVKQNIASKSVFYLSGFGELAISLMQLHPDIEDKTILKSVKDSFMVIKRDSKAYVLPQYPIMFFNKLSKLKKLNINKFYIDLSFIQPNKTYINTILNAYNLKLNLQNENEFNFERGLK